MVSNRVYRPEDEEKTIDARLHSLQEMLPLQFPVALDIETTNLCNLDCFFCPRKEAHKGEGLMEYELFTRIVDECAKLVPFVRLVFIKMENPSHILA